MDLVCTGSIAGEEVMLPEVLNLHLRDRVLVSAYMYVSVFPMKIVLSKAMLGELRKLPVVLLKPGLTSDPVLLNSMTLLPSVPNTKLPFCNITAVLLMGDVPVHDHFRDPEADTA